MWIVRLALDRPYTFIVFALLVLIISPLVILKTPTDVFPNIDIPVISVLWNYTGFSAEDMANRVTSPYERVLTTTVNDIERIESQSMQDRDVIKIFFHPGANLPLALSQVTAVSQTILRQMPSGSTPPLIITYNASSVPVIQLGLSSDTLSEQDLNDLGMNFMRPQLVTVPGVGIPYPYGGKMRQVMIDLDLAAMQAKGVSADDVLTSLNNQNLILPSGTAKIGDIQYNIDLNGSPLTVAELNDLPVRQFGDGSTIYIRDVGHARDGFAIQTNVVRDNGRRGVLMAVMKTGNTSTLDIVSGVKKMLPFLQNQLPKELNVKALFDQSIFVRASINGVVREAVIAACLTALMILLFLGSWRSTLIIAVSIPLSILCSVCALSALGETINLMTLGGLALAVGMLVDDATVAIENINRHLEEGQPLIESILEGSRQIAIPAFVSTLCICIVFVPMFMLSGVARYLFVPLAEAVCFAMMASYFLSRTLVPTLSMYLLGADHHHTRGQEKKAAPADPGFLRRSGASFWAFCSRVRERFEGGFEKMRQRYRRALTGALHHRGPFSLIFLAFCLLSLGLIPFLGQDFFPDVDAGQIRLHVRAKTGTRIEETAKLCDEIEAELRRQIPAKELHTIIDNIGQPYSSINTSYANNGTVGPADAEIQIALSEDHHPTSGYIRKLRKILPQKFPGTDFFFQPADIVTQILNFGIPSPIDIQIAGANIVENRKVARELREQISQVPGAADVHIQQLFDQPHIQLSVDRTKASQLGLTMADVSHGLLVAVSGSGQVSPTYWLNPKNLVNYNLVAEMPDYAIDSLSTLQNLPITSTARRGQPPQILSNLADFSRFNGQNVVTHYNVMPTLDIYATSQGRDLGGLASDVRKLVDKAQKELPRGSRMTIRGQVETMHASFLGLGIGLLGAIVLVYLLIVVNFQSWSDPFIIITALPAALAGIVWMLFITGTTLSVPSLMGSIMCIGVATANSILVISFAKEQFEKHGDALEAALEAGSTRIRPVIMTALAMIIGMIPMAFGMGEGGEQNAPLARAVIGGLLFATCATLFFVPVVFTVVRHGQTPETDASRQEPERKPETGSSHASLETANS
ncbi:MAG: efflux RND transporter permease subunit [Verrucomicrobium sp.]|nr:efflux RND transporter permease subunit [Verrucomicrobium sp.]